MIRFVIRLVASLFLRKPMQLSDFLKPNSNTSKGQLRADLLSSNAGSEPWWRISSGGYEWIAQSGDIENLLSTYREKMAKRLGWPD